MPELPEVEAIVRRLRPEVTGAAIARVEVQRARTVLPQKPATVAAAAGKTIEAVERRGKNIVIRLSSGAALRIHLRMTGILRVHPGCTFVYGQRSRPFCFEGRTRLAFEDRRILGTVHFHIRQKSTRNSPSWESNRLHARLRLGI